MKGHPMKKLLLTLLFVFTAGVILYAQSGEIRKVQVKSTVMNKMIPVTVTLPASYKTKVNRKYPVMYLLHGAGANQNSWNELIPDMAREISFYDIIVVSAYVGLSWYYDSPVDETCKYETFIAKELPAWMDKNFRTVDDRKARALCGASMGGHGALWIGIRHHDRFGAAIAMSAGVNVCNWPGRWGLNDVLGDPEKNAEVWKKHTACAAAKDLKPNELAISLDCGTEDFFINDNRALHQQLLTQRIGHDYQERPGGHTNPYWQNAFDHALIFFQKQYTPLLKALRREEDSKMSVPMDDGGLDLF